MYQRQKSGTLPTEDYKGIMRLCRDAKPQLELELDSDVQTLKKVPSDTLTMRR